MHLQPSDFKKFARHFLVEPGSKVNLKKDFDPRDTHGYDKPENADEILQDGVELLAEYQEKLYTENARSLLVVLQALDAAGKDSTIKHVMSGVNPAGCQVTSFKAPSAEELDHDYLWRCVKALPARGNIGIFNRSHYEDVLIGRVRHLADDAEIERRYGAINAFEKGLVDRGIRIVKVMLHISSDEQKARLAERLDRPDKYWKYNPADVDERALWPQYMDAYQTVFDRTSTPDAPWFVVPADRKWYARLAVQQLLLDALRAMNLQWPQADFDVDAERKRLAVS